MYYIFNKNGECVCSCDFEPNADDLKTRDEKFVESKIMYKDISRLVLNKNKIVEKEIEKENEIKESEIKPNSLADEIKMLKERLEQLEESKSEKS